MAATISEYEPAPTPGTSFPALRLKTPPPGVPETGVLDQLDRIRSRVRLTAENLSAISGLADEALAEIEALRPL